MRAAPTRGRTSLLRAVSHDLRTPLAGVKAAVSSLRQPDVEWSEADRAAFLEAIEVDTDRLTEIITNLLDLSKLHAGAMRLSMQQTSLDEVVASALHQLAPPAGNVHLDLARDANEVFADPALLERVIANLLGNALDWSPPGRDVWVAARPEGDRVQQLHIVDHGPGIPVRDREAVVQPFHRLDDVSLGGLGLGLAIADQMTAAMGGDLELWDTPGGGLTAVVSLEQR